jgi:hypothetical protein
MDDLTPELVKRMAAAIGLFIADDDLEDVTFRLGATLEHLAALDRLEPSDLAPPAILEPEGP